MKAQIPYHTDVAILLPALMQCLPSVSTQLCILIFKHILIAKFGIVSASNTKTFQIVLIMYDYVCQILAIAKKGRI